MFKEILKKGENNMNKLNLEIKGFSPINKANIELNKINVVGGINSSGKSTVARLLYCYLKADVLNDEKYIRNVLKDKLKMIGEGIKLSKDISLRNMIHEYINSFPQDEDVDLLIELLSQDDQISYTTILRDLIVKENLDLFKGYSKLYDSSFTSIFGNDFNKKEYNDGFVEVRSKMRESVNDEELDKVLDRGYLDDFYDECGPDMSYEEDMADKFEREFEADIALGYKLYTYKTKGSLNVFNDVFYIDSISILDLLDFINSEKNDKNKMDVIYPKSHIKYLINSLCDTSLNDSLGFDIIPFDLADEEDIEIYGLNKENACILKKIFDIINGSVSSGKKDVYYSFDDIVVDSVGTGNIASGIKQIGILQLLISNGKLNENSFLIIDEPEVNLHPYWQFKFAEILVMLAKEFDIMIYINSHSPMFIEAIDAFTEFNDMQKDINYYLTTPYEDTYDFVKIESDELYKIYDTLGKPYDLIDELRLRKHLGD